MKLFRKVLFVLALTLIQAICFSQTNGPGHSSASKIAGKSGSLAEVNSEGQLHVVERGKVDLLNSTIIPLLASATFTGGAVDILDYSAITILVGADVTGTLKVQYGPDGIDWHDGESYDIEAGAEKFFTPPTQSAYYRLVYTNNGTPQTLFFIHSVLKKQSVKWSSHNIDMPITDQDDAEVVKSVLTGKTPSGIYTNVKVSADGDLTISDNSNGLSIAEGNVTGKTFVHKFGQAPDFDYGDGVVSVWDGADDGNINQMVYQYSTTNAIDTISSASAADTQDIKIQGLDADYNLVTQTATLNGQNKVTLTTPLIRVFRLKNDDATDLAGYVYVYEDTAISGGVPTDSTKVRAIIQNGYNQTLMAIYTIPAGKTGYLRDWYGSTAGASKDTSYVVQLRAREYDETAGSHRAFQLKMIASLTDGGTTYIQHKYEEPEKFTEKTDVEMRVSMTSTGATGAAFSAGFDIVLVDN